MKKIISAIFIGLALASLSGCGREKVIVPNDDGEDAVVYVTRPATTTRQKVRNTNKVAGGDGAAAEETVTTAAEEESTKPEDTTAEETTEQDGAAEQAESPKPTEAKGGAVTTAPADKTPVPTEAPTDAPAEVYYLDGIVYRVDGRSVLINESDLDMVTLTFKDAPKDVKAGDRVEIAYDGILTEDNTAQAYSLTVTEKADREYKLQKFNNDNLEISLSFSLLVPADWSSRVIEYPTEGDYTDWGVRLTPSGVTGGVDISWHSAFSIREPYDVRTITVNGMDVRRYSKEGAWRFCTYDNDFIVSNTCYGTELYDEYTPVIEFMLETLTFN